MNHRTTSLLVATAAIATMLVAAGIVAALGSNQFALAHKEYNKSYDMYDKYGRDNNYGKDQKSDGSQYLKCIVIGGSDSFKRSDGEKQRADQVTIPGGDSGSGGITDNSCNNFDEGANIPPTPTPTPTPLPGQCSTTDFAFDIQLQAPLSITPLGGKPIVLPVNTVICANQLGNHPVLVILDAQHTVGVTLNLDQPNQATCTAGSVLALSASGIPPTAASTSVCVHQNPNPV
jgi:hypothetical protein